eukprot:4980586-Amphidinium_carterae.1
MSSKTSNNEQCTQCECHFRPKAVGVIYLVPTVEKWCYNTTASKLQNSVVGYCLHWEVEGRKHGVGRESLLDGSE